MYLILLKRLQHSMCSLFGKTVLPTKCDHAHERYIIKEIFVFTDPCFHRSEQSAHTFIRAVPVPWMTLQYQYKRLSNRNAASERLYSTKDIG